MRRGIFVVAALALLLAGCVESRMGVFGEYEQKTVGQAPSMSSRESRGNGWFPVREPTGRAVIYADDGTTLAAECPYQGLKEGTIVELTQRDDGTWVVSGVRQ